MKKILATALALCMALGLVACGGLDVSKLTMPAELALEAGETGKLDITYDGEATDEELAKAIEKAAITWASSDEAVATVDAEGTVTAVAAGEADVTATSQDGKTALTCHVTVTEPAPAEPEGTKVDMGSDGMDAVQAMKDNGVEFPENIDQETMVWSSSNPAVATVDASGHITPVGVGECVITVNATLLDDVASNMKSTGSSGGIVFLSATTAPSATAMDDSNTWSAELHIVVCEPSGDSAVTDEKDTSTEAKDSDKKTEGKTPSATPAPGKNNGSTATGGETANGGNETAGGNTGSNNGSPATGSESGNGGNNNVGTGVNPNEGGAIGGGNTTVPGDGSWAVDGGNATPDTEVPDLTLPSEPVPAPETNANAGTGVNPNEGGAIGGGNTTVPGDGSWAVDGGNATPDTEVPDLTLPG